MDTITQEYKAKIDKYLKGIYNLSPTARESYFSWSVCECCCSTLGGDRSAVSIALVICLPKSYHISL